MYISTYYLIVILCRTPASEIEEATCTDIQQKWGKLKKEVDCSFVATPVVQFWLLKKRKDIDKFIIYKKKTKSYLPTLTEGS